MSPALLFPIPFLIALKLRGCKIDQSMQRSFTALVSTAHFCPYATEGPTLARLPSRQDVSFGQAVALHLICPDHARYIPQALEQLAKQLLGGLLVAAALHQHVDDVIS